MACKPELTSLVTVINPDGTTNYPKEVDGTLVWEWIIPDSTVKYKVETFPEGGDVGMSDEFTFSVVRQDYTYMKQLSDTVYEESTTAQKKLYDDEIIQYLNKEISDMPLFTQAVADNLDMDRTLANIYSTIKNTDSEGKYEGTYKIPKNAGYGQYAFLIAYGYDEKSREQTDAKAMSYWDFLLISATIVSLTILAILVVWYAFAAIVWLATAGAGLTGIGGGGMWIGGLSLDVGLSALILSAIEVGTITTVAIIAADVAFFWWLDSQLGATEQFINAAYGFTRNPSVGENKYGCVFKDEDGEISSLVHAYGSIVAPDIQFDESGGLDTGNNQFDWKDKKVLMGMAIIVAAIVGTKIGR
jgi:hypothetical protein